MKRIWTGCRLSALTGWKGDDRKPQPFAPGWPDLSVQERVSGKGNRFAFVQLTDKAGLFEVTLFSETLQQHRDVLKARPPCW